MDESAANERLQQLLDELKYYAISDSNYVVRLLEILALKNLTLVDISYRTLYTKTNINISTLNQLSQILTRYDNNYLLVTGDWFTSDNALSVYARNKKADLFDPIETKKSLFSKLDEKITSYFRDMTNPNREEEANRFIHKLRRYIRPDKALRDKYYLAYSDCVCCGTSGMGEELPLREVNEMLMPICDTCYKSDYINRIKWNKVSKIYHEYAQILEEAADYYTEKL